jgi:hypothetical protein
MTIYTTREVAKALEDLLANELEHPVIQGLPLWSARRIQPPLVAVLLSGVDPEGNYLVLGRGVVSFVYSVICYGEDEQRLQSMVDGMVALFGTANVEVLPSASAYMLQAIRAESTTDEVAAQHGMEFILQVLQGA